VKKLSLEKLENVESASHKEATKYSYEIMPFLQGDSSRSPLYAVMVSIYKGKNTLEKIYDYFKVFYSNEMSYIKLTQTILDELIQGGINNSLIQKEGEILSLSEKGKEILIKGRKVILTESKFLRFFFNEKVVLAFSLICLIIMSSLKIIIGLNSGSDALFNEGIENFTDIIKVFIIFFSIKFKKDKQGSLIIIILMLFTGISLVISSFFSLINTEIITPNYFTFVLMFLSIIINFILLFLKNFVGKLSGNFSLLSDAKDNRNNIRLSIGVIIGLFFAIFEIYFIDALIGIFIASLIIYDGAETLKELIKSGDKIEIDTFKLKIDEAFEFKIAHWILITIHEKSLSKEKLNNRFIEAIEKGYEIYDIWAMFGLYDIKKYGIYKILNLMEKRGLFIEKDNKTSLTDKGKKQYNRAITREFRTVTQEKKKYRDWKPPSKKVKILWGLLSVIFPIVIILLLIFVGPTVYDFIINFLKSFIT